MFFPLKVICREERSCLLQEIYLCHRREGHAWDQKALWEPPLSPCPGAPGARGQHGGSVLYLQSTTCVTLSEGMLTHFTILCKELLFHLQLQILLGAWQYLGQTRWKMLQNRHQRQSEGFQWSLWTLHHVPAPVAALTMHLPTPRAE